MNVPGVVGGGAARVPQKGAATPTPTNATYYGCARMRGSDTGEPGTGGRGPVRLRAGTEEMLCLVLYG